MTQMEPLRPDTGKREETRKCPCCGSKMTRTRIFSGNEVRLASGYERRVYDFFECEDCGFLGTWRR